MRLLFTRGDDRLARVYVLELEDGARIECVESVQPPVPRNQKWVLIVSTLRGCPIGCPICDAGGHYRGALSAGEILGQIDFLIRRRFPSGVVPVPKLKVQFARMGEPALNPAVPAVLRTLAGRRALPGLLPSISTIAPAGCGGFFRELLAVKRRHYAGGRFQLQFSLHTTDETARRRLIPARTWSLDEMASYGEAFFAPGDRKVTLNFAAARGLPLDPERIASRFSPERFLIKLTPINPTRRAVRSGLETRIDPGNAAGSRRVAERFRAAGYETILSIGELAENEIGSNCGMYVGMADDERYAHDGAFHLGEARSADTVEAKVVPGP